MDEDIEMNELHDDPQQLFNQLDHRGFNLLMIAAENGRDDEVTRLLALGFDVNSSIGPHTAASLAYQRRHFDSLYILMNASSKFPPGFNAETTQHAELIAFTKLMNHFHEYLFGEETRELQTIINEHPHLRYFYNVDGHSAAFEAINNLIINCYELFVRNDILLSPDEDFSEAIESLTDDQKEQVRSIHERHAVPLPNNHLMIIHGSIFVGHDETETNRPNRLNIAQNAINFLNDIPQIQPILKLIARAGGFKIIFDFNRESTQFIDPMTSGDTRGLFCTTRHIYIAARNLLNEVNQMEVYGTIAHELTHFAMDLVYNNNCKPYKEADRDTIGQEFHQILLQSKQQEGVEDIITAVWRYPDEIQFAELIVRVPHMMAFYANNQLILTQRQVQFQSLFNFYTTRVLPDIINKIPTINSEFFVFMSNISFNELSPEDQEKVFNGNVKFLNITLKFHELYNQTNTHLLESLNSVQLRTLLNGKTLDLSDQQNLHLQNQIILVYSNMTDSLRQKLTEGKVNFQGQQLKLEQIIGEDDNSKIFEALNAEQIRKLLTVELIVGKVQEIETKFYIERDFIDYGFRTKYVWIKQASKNLNNFDQISSIANETKMILLSDRAGEGKTTTFKQLSVKLKEIFPHFWISYIDLKRYLKVYEKFERKFQAVEVLQEILSITDELEIKIFTKLFESDRVILLYDGVDEIAPKFKDFFMKFIKSVRNSTRIQQWIATRPQHIEELCEKFMQEFYILMPYDQQMKIELIENVLKDLKIGNISANEILRNIDQMTSYKNEINSPLMIQMMTELYIKDKSSLKDSNMFALYEKMIEMKKDIISEKGEIVSKDRDNQKAKLTIWQIHQIYSLKLIYNGGFEDRLNNNEKININEFPLFKRWKKEKSKWTPEAISRYGFLYVDNWNTDYEFPDFVHRTFAEFFVAHFVIQDLYELDEDDDDDEMSEKEIEMRFKLLIKIRENFDKKGFISSFLDTHKPKIMHKHFFKLITSNEMQKFLIDDYFGDFKFNIIEILILDERFLKEFRFNENLTFFQFSINKQGLNEIQKIADTYERFLDVDWIFHTGYSVKENFSISNNEEEEDILNLIDQFEIPQNHLLMFYRNNFSILSNINGSILIQQLMRFIQNNFHNCKKKLLKTILKKIRFNHNAYSFYFECAKEFLNKLEDFFQSDETISNDDIKVFFTKLKLCSLGIKNVIKSYGEKQISKNEIHQVFIKHSVEIIFDICYNINRHESNASIEDFVIFFNDVFNAQSEKSQLKKFLEMRSENEAEYFKNHTVLSCLNEFITVMNLNENFYNYGEKIKKSFQLMKRTLLDLAKQIEIPDDEIENLSKRLKVD